MEVLGSVKPIVEDGIEERARADCRKWGIDARGIMLLRQLHDVARPIVELATVTCCVLVFGPIRRAGPQEFSSPGMVPHDDDCGGIPLSLLFEDKANMRKICIGENEVVEVRGVARGKLHELAIVNTRGMRYRHMQKNKVNGRIREKLVCGCV